MKMREDRYLMERGKDQMVVVMVTIAWVVRVKMQKKKQGKGEETG